MSTPTHTPALEKRTRRRPAVITVGALGAAALALSMSGTLSAFTASITNDVNTGGLGSLAMKETGPDGKGGTVSCTTDATNTTITCPTINKYGGSTTMTTTGTDSVKTQTITIENPGTLTASTFTLTPGACSISKNPLATTGDLCASAIVTITQDGTQVFTGTAADLAAGGVINLAQVAGGASSNLTIAFSTAGLGNDLQGQEVSQQLTWTFNA